MVIIRQFTNLVSVISHLHTLEKLALNCEVIHATNIPIPQYKNAMKSEPINSKKLVKELKAGSLKEIYIHHKDSLDVHSIIHITKTS